MSKTKSLIDDLLKLNRQPESLESKLLSAEPLIAKYLVPFGSDRQSQHSALDELDTELHKAVAQNPDAAVFLSKILKFIALQKLCLED